MPGSLRRSALPALAAALLLLPSAPAAAREPPSLTGSWSFVRQRSDDLPQKIAEALGPAHGSGDRKKEPARAFLRKWLEGIAEDPGKRVLTIEHTAIEFKAGTGDEVTVYYFGRTATSQGPDGGRLRVSVVRQGERIVTEERQAKGKGRMTAAYALQPGGRSLIVDFRLEHGSLRLPLELRLAFDRIRP